MKNERKERTNPRSGVCLIGYREEERRRRRKGEGILVDGGWLLVLRELLVNTWRFASELRKI